jgi:hypothetical protein
MQSRTAVTSGAVTVASAEQSASPLIYKTYKKRRDFFKFAFYGLDMEPGPEPRLVKSRNRNRKKSYDSTTKIMEQQIRIAAPSSAPAPDS